MEEQLNNAMTQLAAESLRADAAEQELATVRERAASLEGQLDGERTAHDALKKERADVNVQQLKAENTLLKKQVQAQDKARKDSAASEPARIRAAVCARVDLERKAVEVLGDERFDECTDRQLMVKVIERLDGPVEENKPEAYIIGKFDTLVKNRAQGVEAMARVRAITVEKPEERRDNRSARERFIERQNTLATPKESR